MRHLLGVLLVFGTYPAIAGAQGSSPAESPPADDAPGTDAGLTRPPQRVGPGGVLLPPDAKDPLGRDRSGMDTGADAGQHSGHDAGAVGGHSGAVIQGGNLPEELLTPGDDGQKHLTIETPEGPVTLEV